MTVTLTDKYSVKRLIAVGNDEVWYEGTGVSAGTMTKITASDGQIDTTDQLVLFEGFQKTFIVNGSNLKVADFINAKLTHSALTTAHAKGDVLTQATSNATMIVDFTDSTKENTYGYVTSGTFTTTYQVTGSGSGTAFTPSATATGVPGSNQPHWYSWTVYPGGASGSMPAKAYLGCLYRGRCVLSGNPNYPYQWYMSRQANPWDWLYAANDAQSPVAGGNSDAGEIGDIVRALIPYKDEYLIFGCANSLWVLKGDPAEGGVLQEVDLTKGIFGANSWCFDGDGNLYFMSMDGVYVLPSGFGSVKSLSTIVLPKMLEDETATPSTHRVSMGYDKDRFGILISITKLSDGTHLNYWYDLKTNGFFEEEYDTTCGVYSMFYYDSINPTYKGLLLGTKDGYIRRMDEDIKNDETTSSTAAIDAYLVMPVIQAEDDNNKIKLTSMSVTLSGGEASGAEVDSDGVTVDMYSGDDSESVIEAIEDGDTATHTVTVTGPGKSTRLRNRISGHSVAIRLRNNTASQSFGIERISGQIEEIKRY